MLVLRMSELMLFGVGLLRSPTVTIARSPSDTFAGLAPGGVAAFIGAQNFLRIELGIAARGLLARKRRTSGAPLELDLIDQKLDAARLHREADAIAIAHEAERPARSGAPSWGCRTSR